MVSPGVPGPLPRNESDDRILTCEVRRSVEIGVLGSSMEVVWMTMACATENNVKATASTTNILNIGRMLARTGKTDRILPGHLPCVRILPAQPIASSRIFRMFFARSGAGSRKRIKPRPKHALTRKIRASILVLSGRVQTTALPL